MRCVVLSITLVALSALNNNCQANTTYAFEGVVETTSPFLGGEFPVGTPMHGTFTFDPATPDVLGGDPTRGNYLGAVSALSVTIGAYSATSGVLPGDIAVLDSDTITPQPLPHRDAYTVVSLVDGQPVNGHPILLGSLQILDLDGDALTNDQITPPSLMAFSDPLITVDFQPVGSTQNRVWGRLTRLYAVPEPSGFGLLVWAGLLARQQKRRHGEA